MRTANPLVQLWFIPLRQAAVILRATANDPNMEDFAVHANVVPFGFKLEENDIIGWYAYWILQRKLPLFGVKPQSRIIRYLSNKVYLREGGSWGEANSLWEGTDIYSCLYIRRLDLWRYRHEINPKYLGPKAPHYAPTRRTWFAATLTTALSLRVKGWGLTAFRKMAKFAASWFARCKSKIKGRS